MLCIKLFTNLLRSPMKATSEVPLLVSEEEKDILKYIGGAILRILRSRGYRTVNWLQLIKVVKQLTVEDTDPKSLISFKSRGGLTCPHACLVACIFKLEDTFRSVHLASFSKKICINESVRRNAMENLRSYLGGDPCDISSQCRGLFFTIRAHHQCKEVMKYNKQKLGALRQILKNKTKK